MTVPESEVDRMCFSVDNPHARSHNEWVIACGKWHDQAIIADHYRKMWKVAFWAMWFIGAVLYYGK